jgi:hypothetical protein
MGRLVLQIEVDIAQARQLELDQMGVRRPVEVRLDLPDRLEHPVPVPACERAVNFLVVRWL